MLHCILQSHSDDGGFIARSDGVSTWVTFKYERLPMCCHYCGMIRHDLRHCATHFAIEKDGKKVEYQYGDWLKAMGVAKDLHLGVAWENILVPLMLRMVF